MKLEHVGTEKFLLDENAENKINEQLQICQKLINDDYMIIPFCASLVTKFPFIEQIQICLDKLVKMLFNQTIAEKDFFQYLQLLIKGIVIPSPDKSLCFYLPHYGNKIRICGNTVGDLPIVSGNLWKVLNFFSIENIIFVFYLMIMEQKILFVADKHKYLSEIIDAFVNLIYPFQYTF